MALARSRSRWPHHFHRHPRVLLGESPMKWIIFWSFCAALLLGAFLLECGPQ